MTTSSSPAVTSAPSLFVQLRSGRPAAEIYRHTIDIAVRAEQLGFGTIWFATRHFEAHHAALPSVFPFVAAAAQHTTTIRLGTGVVALPFEHPVRLAEDAVVTDTLSGGRLELGVGKGLGFGHSASSYAAFGVPDTGREVLYADRVAALQDILADGRVTDDIVLYPPPGTLRSRIWQSTGNVDTARRAGAAGDGLLPHANSQARADGGVTELVDAYLSCCRGTPRIGSTVTVLPGDSERDSLALLDTDIRLGPAFYPDLPSTSDRRRFLTDNRIRIGSTEQIIERLREDRGHCAATEVLFHIPLAVGHPRYADCLHRVGTEMAPRLDPRPAR
ncbi:LLM class flavin-dependent oxidoreductase [Nocardia sp. NPDC057455]|uniref:LLM class flavin-dependent oxidoreductase n=1 Tax=Nocardia sp. NPDC057455 TaxID=3346138 RepID=UPI00366CA281